MSDSSVPTIDELRSNLTDNAIAGDVATARENNLANFERMSRREPLYLFGLEPTGTWTFDDVLALMAKRCGVSPDPNHRVGPDTIDPDRTIDRLQALGSRIAQAAQRRERVLIATGHPVGLRPTHSAIAAFLAEAGCAVLEPATDWQHPDDPDYGEDGGTIRFVDRVAMFHSRLGLTKHTHSPLPMRALLNQLRVDGQAPPDLVVADHGWAGAAGQAGIDAVGFADCNDPALFVGEAEGRVLVTVPLDDNVAPWRYAAMNRFLIDQARRQATA